MHCGRVSPTGLSQSLSTAYDELLSKWHTEVSVFRKERNTTSRENYLAYDTWHVKQLIFTLYVYVADIYIHVQCNCLLMFIFMLLLYCSMLGVNKCLHLPCKCWWACSLKPWHHWILPQQDVCQQHWIPAMNLSVPWYRWDKCVFEFYKKLELHSNTN